MRGSKVSSYLDSKDIGSASWVKEMKKRYAELASRIRDLSNAKNANKVDPDYQKKSNL